MAAVIRRRWRAIRFSKDGAAVFRGTGVPPVGLRSAGILPAVEKEGAQRRWLLSSKNQ
ncbi:hypothetical protein OH491_16070 [Termitidicoccus mucosus]|uniref:hypothetical protein n=1 Tax=Termitidicoccus mucosus TaxID=1184151 RepID=UPI002FEE3514